MWESINIFLKESRVRGVRKERKKKAFRLRSKHQEFMGTAFKEMFKGCCRE